MSKTIEEYTIKELKLLPGRFFIEHNGKRVVDDCFDEGQALRLMNAFNAAQQQMASGGPLVEDGEHPAALSGEQVEKAMDAVGRFLERHYDVEWNEVSGWIQEDLRQRLTSLSSR